MGLISHHPLRAFAVVETVESAYAIEQNQTLHFILSAQQLISCEKTPALGLDGCKGGVLANAFGVLRSVCIVKCIVDTVGPAF